LGWWANGSLQQVFPDYYFLSVVFKLRSRTSSHR
jgi:hypothetical protein